MKIVSWFIATVQQNDEYLSILNDFGGRGLQLEDAKVVHYDKRVILRVPVKGCSQNVFAKIRLKNKKLTSEPKLLGDTHSEYALLWKVWEKLEGSGIERTISKPLCCGKSEPIIFLGECRGVDFERFLNHIFFRHGRTDILRRVRLAGEWLGKFHSLFADSDLESENSLKILTQALSENVETLSAVLPHSLLQRSRKRILSCLARSNEEIKMGFIHNNYSVRNIIFDKESIGVIDFEGSESGLLYYDIGTFLSEIEMKRRLPAYSAGLVSDMKKEFMAGYSPGFPINESIASAFTSCFMLSYLSNTLRRTRFSATERVNTRFKLFFLKNWLSSFCANG